MFEWISNLWEDFKSSDFVKEVAEFAIGEQDSMSKEQWNKKAAEFATSAMVPFQMLGTPGRFISENLAANNIFINYLRTNPSEYFLNPTKMWDDYFRARDAAIGNRDGLKWYEEGSNKITFGQAWQGMFDPGLDFENMTEQDRINYFDDGMAKWFSGTSDFISLFLTDPFTYVTGGTVAAARGGVTGAAKGLVKGGVAAAGKGAVSGAKRALFKRRMTEIVRRAEEKGLSNQDVIQLARQLGATMKLDDELGKELIPYDFSGTYLGMPGRDVPDWMRPKAASKDSDDIRSMILNAENTVADPFDALRMMLYPKREMTVVQGTVEYTDLVMRMLPRFSSWDDLTPDMKNIVPSLPDYSYFSDGKNVWASDGIDLFEFVPNKVPFKKVKTKNGIFRKPRPGNFRVVKSLPAFAAKRLMQRFEKESIPTWQDQDEAFIEWLRGAKDMSLSGTGAVPKDYVPVVDDIIRDNPELNIGELDITRKKAIDSLKFLFERSFDESFPNVNLNTVSGLHDIDVFPLVIGNVTSETGSTITKPIRFDTSRKTKLPAGTRFATVKLRVPIRRKGAKQISETRDLGELGIATGQPRRVTQPAEVIRLKRNVKKRVPVTYTSKVKSPGSVGKGRKDIIEQVETGTITVPGKSEFFDYQYIDPETGAIKLVPEVESENVLYKIVTVPLAIVPTAGGIPKVYRLATFRRTINQVKQKEIPPMTDIEVDELLMKNTDISLIDETSPNYIKNVLSKAQFQAVLKNISTRDTATLNEDMRVFLRLEDPDFQAVQSELDAVKRINKEEGIVDTDLDNEAIDYMLTDDGLWINTKTGEVVDEDIIDGAQSYTDIVDEFYEYLARESDGFEYGEGAFDEGIMGEQGLSISGPTEPVKGIDPYKSRNAWVQIEGLRPEDFVGFEYPHYNPFTGKMKTVTIPKEYTLVKDMSDNLMRLVFRDPAGKLWTLSPFDELIPVEKFDDAIKLWEASQVELMSLLASAIKLVEKRDTSNVFLKDGWSQAIWKQLSEGETVTKVVEDFVPERTVFVFGSNLKGIHGKGAALEAKQKHGAIQGKGVGLHGDSYALPTKRTPSETLPLEEIKTYVNEFLKVAEDNPNVLFDVTDFGTGLAGYTPEEIASLFDGIDVPPNLRFGPKLRDLIKPSTKKRNLKMRRVTKEREEDVGARFVEQTSPQLPYKTTVWFKIVKEGSDSDPMRRIIFMRSVQAIEKDWAGGYRVVGDPGPDEIVGEWVLDQRQWEQFSESVLHHPDKQIGYSIRNRESREVPVYDKDSGEPIRNAQGIPVVEKRQPLTILSDEWESFAEPRYEEIFKGRLQEDIDNVLEEIKDLNFKIATMRTKKGGAKAVEGMIAKQKDLLHRLYGPLYKQLEEKIGNAGFLPSKATIDDGTAIYKPTIKDTYSGRTPSIKEEAVANWVDVLNRMFGTTVARVPKPEQPDLASYLVKNFAPGYGRSKSPIGIHSGGADGADTVWAEEASKLGIPTYAYAYKGMWGFKGTRPKLEERIDLSYEELEAFGDTLDKVADILPGLKDLNGVVAESKKLGRVSQRNGLIYRNAYQVEESDAVIAVGIFGDNAMNAPRRTVSGGTGWAVEYGILKRKPVYLFDLESSKWFEFDTDVEDWIEVDMPPVFSHFAGIGTREITLAGKKAIRSYLQKVKQAKGELLDTPQSSATLELSKPITPAATTDPVESIVVTKSTPEEFDRLLASGEGVYIGRAGRGQSGEFGNPFKIPNGATDEEVKYAVQKYRKWLWEKIQQDPEYAAKLYELKGKKLVCPGTEKPELCHGNVIKNAIAWLDNNPSFLGELAEPIESFKGQYGWLSNFSDSAIEVDGVVYPTVEHAFQAAKFKEASKRQLIAKAKTPAQARKMGKEFTGIRSDWNDVRVQIMLDLLRKKFDQNPELKQLLINTGKRQLIEGNSWNDKFWGVSSGEGENVLGKLLMQLREEYKGNQ